MSLPTRGLPLLGKLKDTREHVMVISLLFRHANRPVLLLRHHRHQGVAVSNKWPKCPTCLLRHRPGECKGRVDLGEITALIANDCQSTRLLVSEMISFCDRITANIEKLRDGV